MIDMRVRLPNDYRQVSEQEMASFYGKYNEVLDVYTKGQTSTKQLINNLNENNIDLAVVHAEYEFGEDADELNKNVATLVMQYPNQLRGFGTVNLQRLIPLSLIKQAEEIHNFGLKGINLQPIFFDVDPLDRRLYPLYATAEKLGLILSFHTGVHFSLKSSIIKNNPLFLDQIAVDFPTLKLIACHGGWPWIAEMTAVARRHTNVFIEFGGLDPKYIGLSGSGWDTLFTLMNNLLSDQILFGTDWPVMTAERAIKSWERIGLKKEVLNKLFYENAQKLMEL
ncbi:amidohydrolase family protein [Pseudogracilibacillus auburnensis]|uniref:amidohydrolase family protein n=1 Tax=Pseudogracilibacillus auburnensis TaxID=1494959 RepID=UPI001A96A005|nr:amidohydrolase family protein [Pseudogracilibacillus auburnensis]MBO1001897.1 amidohydrolase [Pseudogracilibacillus auburnensis]